MRRAGPLILTVTLLSFITHSHAQTPVPAHTQALISGIYPVPHPTGDGSGLEISSATKGQIPTSPPYGDQGFQVNAWGVCQSAACFPNPSLGNSDILRLVGVNPGGSAAQTNGLSVYMLGNASNSDGQTTGIHIIGVSNNAGAMWGYNDVLADAPYLQGYSGQGRYLDNEFDFNVGDPKTIITGLSVGGTLLTSPAYGAGFSTNFIGPGKLTESFYSWDGAANIGLHLGLFAKPQTANAGSQPIKIDYADNNNNKQSLFLTGFGNTLVLGGTNGTPAYAVAGASGITTTATIGGCTLAITGGLITGKSGGC